MAPRRLLRPFASLALAAAAIASFAPVAQARPIFSGILPEHAIFPGATGSYTFFADAVVPTTDAARLRLKGPVTSVTISVEANMPQPGGQNLWISQGPPAVLTLTPERNLHEVNIAAAQGGPAIRMMGAHEYTGEGADRRRTATSIKVRLGDEEREFASQKFAYDDQGRMVSIDSLTPEAPPANEAFTWDDKGRLTQYKRTDPMQTSSLSTFADTGLLTQQTAIESGTGAPIESTRRSAKWTEARSVAIGDGSDQPCENCGEFAFDDKGTLARWVVRQGDTLHVLMNAVEYDAKGNWIALTTSQLENPADEKTAQPLVRYRRTFTYDGDPLPQLPPAPPAPATAAPAAPAAPKADDSQAPASTPPAKKD